MRGNFIQCCLELNTDIVYLFKTSSVNLFFPQYSLDLIIASTFIYKHTTNK